MSIFIYILYAYTTLSISILDLSYCCATVLIDWPLLIFGLGVLLVCGTDKRVIHDVILVTWTKRSSCQEKVYFALVWYHLTCGQSLDGA